MNNNAPSRLAPLDVLRFLAVFLVIGNHLPVCSPETNYTVYKVTEIWNRGGWVGVDLFFVLSGFLVSGLLFREYQKTEKLDFKKFLIRRGFKIYPPFWTLIIITSLVTYFITNNFYRQGILGELLFAQNYYANYWGHTWSLAVEEHFYIFLCIVFFFLVRWRKPAFDSLPRIFIFIAIVCFSMRYANGSLGTYEYLYIIEPTHLRLDSLFFGVLISYYWHFKNLSEHPFLLKNKLLLASIGVACFIPPFIFEVNSHFWMGVLGVSFLYFGSGLLLVTFLKLDFSKNKLLLFLATIGTYSYSIYLWNMPTQYWLHSLFTYYFGEYNWWLFAVLYFFGTFLIGIGMSKLVEYPVLRVRDKYFPSSTSPMIKN